MTFDYFAQTIRPPDNWGKAVQMQSIVSYLKRTPNTDLSECILSYSLWVHPLALFMVLRVFCSCKNCRKGCSYPVFPWACVSTHHLTFKSKPSLCRLFYRVWMQIWAYICLLLQPGVPLSLFVFIPECTLYWDWGFFTTFFKCVCTIIRSEIKLKTWLKKIQLGLQQDTHNLYKANKYSFIGYSFFHSLNI